ncbi:nucleoid-associated protein [Pseudoalteromonas citrea]|uniref:Nucleoid-associated protein n=2 Tax=Pseudoalteromonas citrea TaxID=43655 RepID=A0AAD4ALT2_9GAMM|nr:nucleoid-associated protein [Pseudoalteromonas citrea]KAF7775072.1 nucleoid-associated protein [Pseudoalteromonas citrea]
MSTIQRFVIHELFKGKVPDKASELLDLEHDIILDLAQQLLKVKDNRTAVLWGQFKSNADFPMNLKELNAELPESEQDKVFFDLTISTMDALYDEIVHTNSKGGYICFIEYKSFKDTRLMAAMITNTAGIKLTNLKPTKEIHVDLSKLHQAVDINVARYFLSLKQGYTKNYLSFIGKGKDTDYFANSFGCINKTTPAKAVAKAPRVLKDFLEQFEADHETQKSARSQLVKYLSDNVNKEVHLTKINEIAIAHVPESCTEEQKQSFIEFSKQDDYEMPATFYAAKNSVDKLAKVYYSGEAFNLNFDLDSIGLVGIEADSNKPILFDQESDDVIIRGQMITDDVKEAILAAINLSDKDDSSTT